MWEKKVVEGKLRTTVSHEIDFKKFDKNGQAQGLNKITVIFLIFSKALLLLCKIIELFALNEKIRR
jgi:hypothetical protein